MASSSVDAATDKRRYLAVFATQLTLMGVAVLVSRLGLGVVAGAVAVMLVAALNAATVAISLMGIRRDGWIVSALVLMTLFFIVGLLIWPAWDVSQRGRVF